MQSKFRHQEQINEETLEGYWGFTLWKVVRVWVGCPVWLVLPGRVARRTTYPFSAMLINTVTGNPNRLPALAR